MPATFADKIDMQNRLFVQLSKMFGQEVPLYDKSLLVNRVCNRCVCDLLSEIHIGFSITDDQLDQTSGERHGAVRIGTPTEYRWVTRYFGAFALEPHNFYDMTNVGAKSQPIIATGFRSTLNPEHRVFTSLLMTDYFDATTRARIEALLATREVFPARAKELVERSEREGGLSWDDADALIREGVERIFRWTGTGRDHRLYTALCDAGFKIAADIACFDSHHLNHLTPNTFCMDLYTAAMKLCLGEQTEPEFRERAEVVLNRFVKTASRDSLRLLFKHLTDDEIDAFEQGPVGRDDVTSHVDKLTRRLMAPDLHLDTLEHSGFKDTTEGPPENTPVLLRQDAYKALTEPVTFREPGGATIDAEHTARFGEVEQRFYATTPTGRALYDRCLDAVEQAKAADPELVDRDFGAYEAMYARNFAAFPKTLMGLLEQKLVFGCFHVTAKGLAAAARGKITTTDILELVRLGFARCAGQREEDFLPVSAAGIFASNLSQYGTKSTAAQKPAYSQAILENVMGRKIVDATTVYGALEAESKWDVYSQLGVLDRLTPVERAELEATMASGPTGTVRRSAHEQVGSGA